MKLTIELVPKTAWYSNVRSNVSKQEWDAIRFKVYDKAQNVCELCGDVGTNQGKRWKVECHEIWSYKDGVQTLDGMQALCPNCHQVKHVGLAQLHGKEEKVIKQLQKVNNITREEAMQLIYDAFVVWNKRSQQDWKLDISILKEYK